jgi:hypothetical protein
LDKVKWARTNCGLMRVLGVSAEEMIRLYYELYGTQMTIQEGFASLGYSPNNYDWGGLVDGVPFHLYVRKVLRGMGLQQHYCGVWADGEHECLPERQFPEVRGPQYVLACILNCLRQRYTATVELEAASTLDAVETDCQRIRELDSKLEVLFDMIGRKYTRPPLKGMEPPEWPLNLSDG